jgi:hypothetical protein
MVLCLATYPAMRGVAPRCIALNLTRLRGPFEPLLPFGFSALQKKHYKHPDGPNDK